MASPADPVSALSPLKRALLALDDMKARLDAAERARGEPIAIVGMGCRFPGGAADPESFWRLLHAGVNTITEVPKSRWDVEEHFDADPTVPGKAYGRWGAFLGEIDRFDPQFFGIAPREAAGMDPQQRLLLEVTWEALEHAGISPAKIAGTSAGVFVGINSIDYAALQLQGADVSTIDAYSLSGTAHSISAGRLAYVLGLQGPAMAIDTACSSSLVALHLACQSLRNNECRTAVAGGVHVVLTPLNSIIFSKLRMLAADGRCKTFDARGDGFVEGEGCAVVVLKRLSDALADGDRIVALVRGSAVNQDGASSGLTAPNGPSQESVIRAALERGGVRPSEVDFVEAHGTGTSLGDPIEVQALAAVLGQDRPADRPVLIGSVKTNIGHTQAAAGIAGLVKLALALEHEAIPPSLHFEQPNPYIPWPSIPVRVVTEATPWPRRAGARRVGGVSSFGFSGTNVHIVLEEAPAAAPAAQEIERPLHVLTVSARSSAALQELAGRLAARIESQPADRLPDIAFTANAGRAHLPERAALVAASREEALARLRDLAGGTASRLARGRAPGEAPKVAFLFTGQGAQYVDMGRQLYESQPAFRHALDRCAALLQGELDQPLLSVLYPPEGGSSPIDQTGYAQPALFAIEYALAEMWRSWGVVPSAVLGHSIGEYAAACVAGVLSLEDAITLVAARGRLMQSLPPGGAMAAVFAGEAQVTSALSALGHRVAIAAVNAPENVVISGAAADVAAALARLDGEGVAAERLNVSHAFHSSLMDPILDEFEAAAARVTLRAPQIALISNLSGEQARREIAEPGYWRRHLRGTVNFSAGVDKLRAMGYGLFVEIGPRPTLSSLAARSLPAEAVLLPSLRKAGEDWPRLLDTLAALYVRGVDIDWAGFDRGYSRRKVLLPTYPFERERHWLAALDGDRSSTSRPRSAAKGAHPLLGTRIASALKDVLFDSEISVERPAFLTDHRKRGAAVFPATAYLEMGLSAAGIALGPGAHVFEELVISDPLILTDAPVAVQTVLTPDGNGAAGFQLFSRLADADADAPWRAHAAGIVRTAPTVAAASDTLDSIRQRCGASVAVDAYYEGLLADGHEYGPTFRGVKEIWRGEWEALATIELPAAIAGDAGAYRIHPALLDASMQILAAAVPDALKNTSGDTFLPVSLGRVQVHAAGARGGWSHARVRMPEGAEADGFSADIRIYDSDGRVVAEIEDVYHKRISSDAIEAGARQTLASWLYEIAWQPQPLSATTPTKGNRGVWLVLGESRDTVVDGLAARLTAAGLKVIVASRGASYLLSDTRAAIDPGNRDHYVRLLTDAAAAGGAPVEMIVHAWAADSKRADDLGSVNEQVRDSCGSLLALVQALAGSVDRSSPRLSVVTRGATAAGGAADAISVAHAPVWALARTVGNEHPDLRCRSIDLDPDPVRDALDEVCAELLAESAENQVAYRDRQRYVARLERSATARAVAAGGAGDRPVSLEIGARGVLDRLTLQPLARRAPGSGEIEIRVAAAGLNFRDVLNALGMYEGEAGPLGTECVGTVVAVGPGVTHLKAGDEVLGMAPASFRSFVTAPAGPFIVKPATLSFEEAATIPVAFLTAEFALKRLGGLRAGERVLIHAAAGGVGLAAVQIAQRAGAEIFATAGSPEKHAYLRSLGVTHIFSSRTADFAERLLELTGGKGIDVVLNSLTGEFITQSVRSLAHGGRFLEIGKAGIWTPEQMAAVRPDVKYIPIYFTPDDHALVQDMLGSLTRAFAADELKPLNHRAFPVAESTDAFRFMAQAKHIGKIVLRFEDAARSSAGDILSDATYLITGGGGSLGISVARWLIDAGARHVVLVSRRAPAADAAAAVDEMRASGAEVVTLQADVSRAGEVSDLLARIAGRMPALRGIVHAAGAVDDGMLVQQTWGRFDSVMAPKIAGAWNLHQLTSTLDLDFFVMFSSMVSMFGAPGQGNYAAANAFMDALAHRRRAEALPALSIDWGPWDGGGMASRVTERDRQRWRAEGYGTIGRGEGTALVGHLLRHAAGPRIAVLPIDWPTLFRQFKSGDEPPLLASLAATYTKRAAAAPARRLLTELEAVAPNRRRAAVAEFLRLEALKVLGLSAATTIDPRQPLSELGLDSLMAVELRNGIAAAVERTLPATLLFKHPTLDALTDFSVSLLGLEQPPAPDAHRDTSAEDLAPVSDEEARRLLAAELESLGSWAGGES